MMTPSQTRTAATATFFGSHGTERASICYTAGAVLSAADRGEFFSKLGNGNEITFSDAECISGWIEVGNRRVYFTANAGVVSIRATNENELGRATAKLAEHGRRTEQARQIEIEAATEAQQRWMKLRD
jgi:hypothetical protein